MSHLYDAVTLNETADAIADLSTEELNPETRECDFDQAHALLGKIAPKIAAKALRDAADSAQHHGTAATNASAVRVWLRNRADELDPS